MLWCKQLLNSLSKLKSALTTEPDCFTKMPSSVWAENKLPWPKALMDLELLTNCMSGITSHRNGPAVTFLSPKNVIINLASWNHWFEDTDVEKMYFETNTYPYDLCAVSSCTLCINILFKSDCSSCETSLAGWLSHSLHLKSTTQHEAVITRLPDRDAGRLSSAKFLIVLRVTAEWLQFSSLWHLLLSDSFMCRFTSCSLTRAFFFSWHYTLLFPLCSDLRSVVLTAVLPAGSLLGVLVYDPSLLTLPHEEGLLYTLNVSQLEWLMVLSLPLLWCLSLHWDLSDNILGWTEWQASGHTIDCSK